ncbi:MAG: M48 family metallopeptidase [Fidelibacterota bacterium]
MERNKAKRYNNTKLILSIAEGGISLIFIIWLLFSGASATIAQYAASWVCNPYLQLFVFLLMIGFFNSVVTFPVSFYKDYLLEHKYELSNQSLRKYFWEKFKGLLVALPIVLILMAVFYFLLRRYPENWWVIMGTVIVLFSVILSRLAPTLIFPLFYKFTKLENDELKEKIESLCQSVGMELDGLYQFDMSKNTKKANAAFTGIGKTKRIILGDTLLNNLSDEQILAVLSHELGHFKLNHIWKGMTAGVLLNYLGLYLVDLIYSGAYSQFGSNKYSLAALPLMAILLSLFSIITGPLTNMLSRKHEREADDFAVDLMQEKRSLKTGLKKLSDQNLGDEKPHPVVEFLFYSHPSTGSRIQRLGGLDEEPA